MEDETPSRALHPQHSEAARFYREKKGMKHLRLILFLIIILLIKMTNPPFSRAENFNRGELAEKFKIYNKAMNASEGWQLMKDKKGIKVYQRKTSLTPINAFKGVAELETDLKTLVAFLMDVYKFPSWIDLCNSVEFLEPANEAVDKIDQVHYYLYTVNRPPWPVKPRDNVIYTVVGQDSKTLTLRIKSISMPDSIPHKKGFVRCPLLMVEWILKPLDKGHTELSFEVIINAGGWIPAWVINFYAVNGPYTTILNIRKQIPFDKKYKQKQIKWLKIPTAHNTPLASYCSPNMLGKAKLRPGQ